MKHQYLGYPAIAAPRSVGDGPEPESVRCKSCGIWLSMGESNPCSECAEDEALDKGVTEVIRFHNENRK